MNNTRSKKDYSTDRIIKREGIAIIIFIIAAIIILITLTSKVDADASSSAELSTNKTMYYTSYEIESGDTLTDIAAKFNNGGIISNEEYIRKLKDDNLLKSDMIKAGDHIVVTYYK